MDRIRPIHLPQILVAGVVMLGVVGCGSGGENRRVKVDGLPRCTPDAQMVQSVEGTVWVNPGPSLPECSQSQLK